MNEPGLTKYERFLLDEMSCEWCPIPELIKITGWTREDVIKHGTALVQKGYARYADNCFHPTESVWPHKSNKTG